MVGHIVVLPSYVRVRELWNKGMGMSQIGHLIVEERGKVRVCGVECVGRVTVGLPWLRY